MGYDDVCTFPIDMVGTEVLNSVYVEHDSTQRITMGSKAQNQWIPVEGCEFPKTFTGYETSFRRYTFDKSPIPYDDVIVLKVIKKYTGILGQYEIKNSPKWTVFYRNKRTGKVGHFDIDNYRYLSPGFGYFTEINKSILPKLKKDSTIPKGSEFINSVSNKKPFYNQGMNVNVAFMSLIHTSSDPVVITQELAEKGAYWTFEEVIMHIQEDKIPIGLYGSDEEHKFMPDIGEQVNEEGMLAVFRPFRFNGLFSEYSTEEDITTVRGSDTIYRAHAGATVVDIDIFTSPKKWDRIKSTTSLYHQLYKYQYQTYLYYKEFLDVYDEYKEYGFEDITAFQIYKYACLMPKMGKNKDFNFNKSSKFPSLLNQQRDIYFKDKKIGFCMIKVIIAYKQNIQPGDKLTNRHGNKGVVGTIIPTEHAPYDEFGFRVDMIINPEAMDNRMNHGQGKEHVFTRLAEHVCKDAEAMSDSEAYNYIISFLKDYNPSYGNLIDSNYKNKQKEFIESCFENGIYLNCPITLKHLTPEKTLEMCSKYRYRISPLTYTYEVEEGVFKTETTDEPIAVGSIYTYLLNKHPYPNAVELAYVSQFGLPIKNPIAKNFSIPQTAIRLIGEQEQLVLEASENPQIISRFLNVNGNSPKFAKELFASTLRAEKPSTFSALPYSNKEIQKNNVPLSIVKHILLSTGIDISKEAFYSELEEVDDPELDAIEEELKDDENN